MATALQEVTVPTVLPEHLTHESWHENEPIPLVIVEGFLGGAGALIWGNFENYMNHGCERRRSVFFANIGPVSSLHDRACEMYYAMKGGTVDYGEDHSKRHRHLRYGRTIAEGMYPQWSRERPLHFLGHSLGGPTIIKLQWLLSTGFFGGDEHPDMILSVNTISAPFRGTQVVYALGQCEDAAPAVRPLSVGSAISKGVHLISFLSPYLPKLLDLHAESRSLSCHEVSFSSLLKQLCRSDWTESHDAANFDVTFEAVDERQASLEGLVNLGTYYRSHVACMTRKIGFDNNTHTPSLGHIFALPLYLTSRIMGSFDFCILRPIPSFLTVILPSPSKATTPEMESHVPSKVHQSQLGEEYWANDGIVPVFSQWHPLNCNNTACRHYIPSMSAIVSPHESRTKFKPEPGIWHVHRIEDVNHCSVAPRWLGTTRQKHFWEALGCWLGDIDENRSGHHLSDSVST